MQLSDATFGWNELDFLDEAEFRQMAPPIVKLEIDRIQGVLGSTQLPEDLHDRLLRASFELSRFVSELEEKPRLASVSSLADRLATALLNIGFSPDGLEAPAVKEIKYVTERLSYIHKRMDLIY